MIVLFSTVINNKTFVDSRLCPGTQLVKKTCWSLSLSKIWSESRLLCLSYSITAYEYARCAIEP